MAGRVPLRLDYYEHTGGARVQLSWSYVGGAPVSPPPSSGAPLSASVTSSYLNVRQGPGVNYGVISTLSRGQVVSLAGVRNADASWVKLILPDGRQGWSYAGFLQSSTPFSGLAVDAGPPLATGVLGAVAPFQLNVRQGPDVGSPVVATLDQHTPVQLTGRDAASSWVRITMSDGSQGWVNASYLHLSQPLSNVPVIR